MTPLFPSQTDGGSSIGCAGSCINDDTDSTLTEDCRDALYVLPSPDEMSKTVADAFHGSFVPIDVSGVGLQRMASFRRSLTYVSGLYVHFGSPKNSHIRCSMFSHASAQPAKFWPLFAPENSQNKGPYFCFSLELRRFPAGAEACRFLSVCSGK